MAGKGAEFYVLCWVELAGLLLKHLLADIFQLRKEFLVLLSDVSREFPDKPKIVHNQPCLLSVDSKSDDGLDCERQWPVRLNSATAAADSSRSFCRCFRPCSKSSRIYAARMCSPFSENHHDPSGAFFPVYLLLISRHPCTLKKIMSFISAAIDRSIPASMDSGCPQATANRRSMRRRAHASVSLREPFGGITSPWGHFRLFMEWRINQ